MSDAAIFALQLRKRSVGQGVKTPPFHGGITGSIPVRSTSHKDKYIENQLLILLFFV